MTDRNRISDRIRAGGNAVKSGRIPSIRERCKTLKRMLILLVSHREAAYSVLADDLGRSRQGAVVSEVLPLIRTLKYMIRKMPALMRAKKRSVSLINFPGTEYIIPEPYGQVLVAGAWNFPLLSALEPVIGAYASGNHVVLKLSGRAPKSAAFVRWLVEETFVGDEVISVDHELELHELLEYDFDYVFYTGDRQTASEIQQSGARTLRPGTFFTGGKCPAVVDCNAVLSHAAKRIVQGKFFNAGQCRLSPDFVLVHERVMEKFKNIISSTVRNCFGSEPLQNPDYGKMIDSAAYERVSKFAGTGRLVCGGEKDPENLRIAPTVIDEIQTDEKWFSEEIFGPVLPLMPFSSEEDLIKKLRQYARPPAIYYFGRDRGVIRRLSNEVPAGSLEINDAGMQFFDHRMPGEYVFSTFVRYKSVMRQPAFLDLPWRSLPFRGFWDLILEYWIKWSV